MNKRAVPLMLALIGMILFQSSAQAQRQAAFRFASEVRTVGPRGANKPNLARTRRARHYNSNSLFASPFFSGYDYESGVMDEPPLQLLSPPAQPAAPIPPPTPAESVVLELQGDHWVRLTNYGQSQIGPSIESRDHPATPTTAAPTSTSRQIAAPQPLIELPRAILVFQDGHQEQIANYVIKDATIYTSADYWTVGSWTKKIQITTLNIPATLKLNRDRGTNFTLPSGPHEVMIRP